MRLFEAQRAPTIDNERGLGAVPINASVDYHGLRVTMYPSAFLNLAAPIEEQTPDIAYISQHVKNGGSIASPFLDITIPEEWEDGNFSSPAQVSGHEGRHRMMVVAQVYGNVPTEVHLFFRGGLRARDITNTYVAHLNTHLYKERSKVVAKGPFFDVLKNNS